MCLLWWVDLRERNIVVGVPDRLELKDSSHHATRFHPLRRSVAVKYVQSPRSRLLEL